MMMKLIPFYIVFCVTVFSQPYPLLLLPDGMIRCVWSGVSGALGRGVEVLVKAQGAEGGAEVNSKWTAFIQHFSNQWPLKVLFRILQPARQEQSG